MENLKNILPNIISEEITSVSTDILDKMIENIGTTDSVVRDQLIFSAFCKLIFKDCLEKKINVPCVSV